MLISFFAISLISMLVISVTSLITYEVLRIVWKLLPHLHVMPRLRVLLTIIPIFGLHIINIWIYAGVYCLIESLTNFGGLQGLMIAPGFSYHNFVESLYFSAETYTSLGFGDVVPTQDLRMLASAEVLNGLIMIGWTISFTYLTMEKFWALPHRKDC